MGDRIFFVDASCDPERITLQHPEGRIYSLAPDRDSPIFTQD